MCVRSKYSKYIGYRIEVYQHYNDLLTLVIGKYRTMKQYGMHRLNPGLKNYLQAYIQSTKTRMKILPQSCTSINFDDGSLNELFTLLFQG